MEGTCFDEKDIQFTETGEIKGFKLKGGDEQEAWELLIKYYDNLNINYMDSEGLCEWIDMDNAIDIFLFLDLIQGVDQAEGGGDRPQTIYNMYLAIMHNQQGSLKGLWIPWDMDRTWGNGFGDIPYNIKSDYHVIMRSGYLYQIISNGDTDILEKIFEKYWSLRAESWSNQQIDALLDQYEADIFGSGAYLRDMERWPDGGYADPEDELNTFRAYVMEHIQFMDQQYETVESLLNCVIKNQ